MTSLFAIECTDKLGGLEIRQANRPAHLDYLNTLGTKIAFAGPFLNDEGNPTGSLLMVRCNDIHAAREIADNDPYAKAGLFQSVTVRAWKWVINAPSGE